MSIEAQKKFIESLTNGGMIDSIFGYAYKRCFSEYEAEDLCHEIIIFAAREKIRKEVSDMSEKTTTPTNEIKQDTKSTAPAETHILDALVGMIEQRLKGTGEHPERASLFVKILIKAMLKKGIYADEMKGWDAGLMASASRVHDIGKIAVSDTILMNKGTLTQEEVDIMRRHTLVGEEILQKMYDSGNINTPLLNHAKIFVGSHHEYWNGEGFPRGLKGEEIPLQGRIMAVADWYETLISERPYKKAFTPSEAENIIKTNSGIHFDPTIVALLEDDDVKNSFSETAQKLKT